jgi:hypothetical protein
MSNELIFLTLAIFVLSSTLLAFWLGRAYLIGLIMVEAALMNIFVVKQFDLFGLAITGGNVLYGAIFLATDLLCEHYGKAEARRAVWAGFGAGVFMLVTSQLLTAFIANDFDTAQSAFLAIFSPTARIVVASLASYLLVQHFDVWFFDRIKSWTAGRHLWLRNNLSTIVSQSFDSIFFTAAGLLIIPALVDNSYLVGFIPAEAFWEVVGFTIAAKVVVALLDTPVMYLSYRVKKAETVGEKIKEKLHIS